MIVRPTTRSNGWAINLFIFNFTTMFIQPSFQASSSLANITNVIRRTWNKIDPTQVLNWIWIYKRGKFDFFNRSKRDIETKTRLEIELETLNEKSQIRFLIPEFFLWSNSHLILFFKISFLKLMSSMFNFGRFYSLWSSHILNFSDLSNMIEYNFEK